MEKTTNTKKEIHEVCLPCGSKHGKKGKMAFGMWTGHCDICGMDNIWVASAQHDFGIYNTEQEERIDKAQDRI